MIEQRYVRTWKDVQECVWAIKQLQTVLLILDWKFASENEKQLRYFLTENQKRKLEQYQTMGDRYNDICTHAIVNIVFSQIKHCKICDADIAFVNGKPYIPNKAGIQYNISHTKQCAVLVFHAHEVGIDIENYGCAFDYSRILQRYFRDVCKRYTNIDLQMFYTAWTIKEAYSKFSKEGIKQIEEIEIIQKNQTKAIIKNKKTKECFEITILDIQGKFVVSICFGKKVLQKEMDECV